MQQGRTWIFLGAAVILIAAIPIGLFALAGPTEDASPQKGKADKDGPQKRAEALGIKFEKLKPGYLNWCNRSGKMLYSSGFSSEIKGTLGKNLTVKEGQDAARQCAVRIVQAVWDRHGTLDGLRVIKVLGCVNAAPDFTDHPKVVNGASDLLHEIWGKDTDGHHARSALGFSSLPFGAAVEVEAIFEIKD
jgi:enamine deaminase RidA (YjgF/YER057c/UK114 family)